MERLLKLFAEVVTDEDSDFDNEGNRPEDILEENFSNNERFSEYQTESDGDSGNEEVNNLEWFSSTLAYSGRKQNLGRILAAWPGVARAILNNGIFPEGEK
ncbi:hypothetical protein AVEN_149637-1 [Araneus ventricosus]|uniref:Uncharacterized protein n=1 Tax=Araneus ventricosus TaxID=182803 RepID=A0A4Y2SQY9_ARAVE|nr:hypothetical protein AVEN_149637-1 [Araneus ventricosus]